VADFTVAIQKNANDTQNYDQRALAYRNLKNFDAAITDYTAAIEKAPTYQPEYSRRGYTYALAGQYEKAIVDYQQALKMDPNDLETPERLRYAQGQIAARNAPPATPTPTPAVSIITPARIFFAVVILVIIAVVVRLMTRGKPEEISSSRIR
jgi:tetratricopeptide (TPR) repeat protein